MTSMTVDVLGHRCAIECSPWWIDRLATLFAALCTDDTRSGSAVEQHFAVDGEDGCRLVLNDRVLLDGVRPAAVVDRIMWELNQVAWQHSSDRILVHGAVVEIDGRGVLVCGPSGAGKTTLAAGLCLTGAGYLSDEIAALDRETLIARPYPKPLSVRGPARALLDPLAPPTWLESVTSTSWYVPIAPAPPVRIDAVVLPRHDDDRSTMVRFLPRADALLTVCEQTPHLASDPESFGRLATLVRDARVVEVVTNDLGLACELVGETLAGSDGADRVGPPEPAGDPDPRVRAGASSVASGFRVASSALSEVLDGEAVVYDVATATIHRLDADTTLVWCAVLAGRAPVDLGVSDRDVDGALEALVAADLVERVEVTRP